MNKVRLIIGWEFLSRIRKRSFWAFALLGPVLISLFAYLSIEISGGAKTNKVLVYDEYDLTEKALNNSKWARYSYTGQNISNKAFKASNYDLLVEVNPKFATNNKIKIVYKEKPSPYVINAILRQMELRLEQLKLVALEMDPTDYAKIKQPVDHVVQNIDGHYAKYDSYSGYVGIVFALIIFIFIFFFGSQVMNGVVEEKSNRIVEVMVSSVKPIQLMTGKIIGIALTAILQFLIWGLLTFGILKALQSTIYPDLYSGENITQVTEAAGKEEVAIEINDVAEIIYSSINYSVMIGYFFFFLIAGYLLYAALFGALGAATNSQSNTTPALILVALPLLLGIVAAWQTNLDPGGSVAQWFSIIPFTAPMVMMVRIAIGFESAELWQLYLSMGLMVFTFLLTISIGGKIYRTGILMYGKRASIREIFRWITAK